MKEYDVVFRVYEVDEAPRLGHNEILIPGSESSIVVPNTTNKRDVRMVAVPRERPADRMDRLPGDVL